jgi:hypothetical protein
MGRYPRNRSLEGSPLPPCALIEDPVAIGIPGVLAPPGIATGGDNVVAVHIDDRDNDDLESVHPCGHGGIHAITGDELADGRRANLGAHDLVSMVTAV